MLSGKRLVSALALIVLGFGTTISVGASPKGSHTMYVTFSRPVSLPGVTLRSGTYIFEAPDPAYDHDLVRVLSQDRTTVFFTAFTQPVERPQGMSRDQTISFGEPSREGTLPVLVWWPSNSVGHQFIYPQR
jgi:hypothetical protein